VLRRRARQVVTENTRVLATAELLHAGDLAAVGPLLTASHQSLRDRVRLMSPSRQARIAERTTASRSMPWFEPT
jgi:galactokinase